MKSGIQEIFVSHNITLITLINVPNKMKLLGEILSTLSDANINIDMVSQSSPLKNTVNFSFTLSDDSLFSAISLLKQFNNKIPALRIEVNSNNTKLCLHGEPMRNCPGVLAKTMVLLSEQQVEIKMITTAETEISYLIYADDEAKAVDTIKNYFEVIA